MDDILMTRTHIVRCRLWPRFSHGTDARALQYLARAFYDADRLVDARRMLLRAAHMFPADHTLRFNAALTMQVRFGPGLRGGFRCG